MRFYELLFEYDRRKAIAAFGGKLQDRIKLDPAVADVIHLFSDLEEADPTQNKQYVNWLVKAYQAGSKLEDLTSRGHDSLVKFELLKKHKQLPADKSDIGKYSNLVELEKELAKYQIKQQEQIDRGKYKIFFDDKFIKIIIPEDEIAAKFWGQGTRWCTAANKNNMFNRYNRVAPLYIILPKHPTYKGEKYQLHFQSKQYMDERDEEINLTALIDRYPSLMDAFKYHWKTTSDVFFDSDSFDDQIDAVAGKMTRISLIKQIARNSELKEFINKQFDIYDEYIKRVDPGTIKWAQYSVPQLKIFIAISPNLIEFIDPQLRNCELQTQAATSDWGTIRLIKNPCEDAQIAAVKQPNRSNLFIPARVALQFIPSPSLKVQKIAVNEQPCNIQYIENPSLELVKIWCDAVNNQYNQYNQGYDHYWLKDALQWLPRSLSPEAISYILHKDPRIFNYWTERTTAHILSLNDIKFIIQKHPEELVRMRDDTFWSRPDITTDILIKVVDIDPGVIYSLKKDKFDEKLINHIKTKHPTFDLDWITWN